MNDQHREYLHTTTKTLQIIVGALMAGVLVFAAVVFFIGDAEDNAGDESQMLSSIAIGATLAAVVAAVVVPRLMRAKFRQAIVAGESLGPNLPESQFSELGDVGLIMAAYQSTVIIGAAILEGAAFLNLTSYLVENQPINLACAAALLVGLLLKFPTRNRIEDVVADELKQIEELRMFDG